MSRYAICDSEYAGWLSKKVLMKIEINLASPEVATNVRKVYSNRTIKKLTN